MRITKIVITIYGLLFAVLGVGFWAAPEFLAQRFNIDTLNVAGLSTIRADLGSLFLTLSALCLVGVWAKRRSLLLAATLMLAAIVAGRLIGWAVTGTLSGLRVTLPVEIGAIVATSVHAVRMKLWDDTAPRARRIVRTLAAAVAILVVAGGVASATLHAPKVQDMLFAKAAHGLMARNNTALVAGDDALRVGICGTSSPMPSPTRAKACTAVMAGGKVYIVDAGPESTKTLMLWAIPLDRVAGVFITHFHSDHIGDLGELNLQTWVPGRPAPLAVYGGPGIENVVAGFNTAYGQDEGYRTAHHTAAILPPATGQMVAHPVAMPAQADPHGVRQTVILDDGAMKVTAIETNHAPVRPAYAYRFDYKGRSVVVTGDTTAYAPLAAAARGVDVFVSEALNRQMVAQLETAARDTGRPRIAHIMHDIQSYHVSPTETADIANKAGADLLVLTHLIPSPDNPIARQIFTRGLTAARRGDWDLARDGSLYTLPVGSDRIRIGRVPH